MSMRVNIKQKVFSFGDKFSVNAEDGTPIIFVEGKVFSVGNKLKVLDAEGAELFYIEQKLFKLLPEYFIYSNGQQVAHLKKEFSWLKPKLNITSNYGNFDGNLWRGERFAFDNLQLNDQMTDYYEGDPKVNESYFNYRDTLYAIADGTVLKVVDGRPENRGDAQDLVFATMDEYGGNYVVLDIGNDRYALYAHCVPNEFLVSQGDVLKEGDPIGLLGNSGNSTAPHLHFQITDSPNLLFSIGHPFVIKSYTKVGNFETGPITPATYTNAMMEELSIICF